MRLVRIFQGHLGLGRRVQPESFTHGTSEQRVRWFRLGSFHGARALHTTLGLVAVALLWAHTGLRFGVNLNFAVTVREVREATEEELAHGHSHGPGGHSH